MDRIRRWLAVLAVFGIVAAGGTGWPDVVEGSALPAAVRTAPVAALQHAGSAPIVIAGQRW